MSPTVCLSCISQSTIVIQQYILPLMIRFCLVDIVPMHFPLKRRQNENCSPKSIPCEFAHFNIYMSQSNIYFVSLARSAISLSPSLSLRLLHIFFLSLSPILHFHYYRSSLFHLLCRWCSSSLYSNKSISSLLLSFNLDHRPNLIVNSIPSFN